MSNITKRLETLEEQQQELRAIVLWEDEPVPLNPEGRPVFRYGWARCAEEATPDPSNNRPGAQAQ